MLNQKDNKLNEKSNELEKDVKKGEILDKLTKLKSTSSKFVNQENPLKELGINKQSKSINKKSRQIKSTLKSATKLTNSTNKIHIL